MIRASVIDPVSTLPINHSAFTEKNIVHQSGALWSEWRLLAVLVFSSIAENSQKSRSCELTQQPLSSVFEPALKNTGLDAAVLAVHVGYS